MDNIPEIKYNKNIEDLYMVTIQPYFEPSSQQYVHIMTFNAKPPQDDPLSKIVKMLPTPKMSPFLQDCEAFVYAVFNPRDTTQLINMNTIPYFFEYIYDNGYKLNNYLSNVMTSPPMRNKSIGPKKDILCFIEKKDKNSIVNVNNENVCKCECKCLKIV